MSVGVVWTLGTQLAVIAPQILSDRLLMSITLKYKEDPGGNKCPLFRMI
jgi:hypothetical protein